MRQFDALDLLDTAKNRTGLDDFGPDDFLEPFEVFIGALNAQGEIVDDRWDHLYQRLQRLLMNRLWMAKDIKDHPEILEEDLRTPCVIVSLPRTGSTKLHRMLGATNDFQTTKFWQVNMPSRIPNLPYGGRERRIRETREYESWMYKTSPSFIKGHPIFTDEPEECQLLNEYTFRVGYLAAAYNIPQYSEWLFKADMMPAYYYYLDQLKYLQWQSQLAQFKPWLLKSPHHMGNEGYLTRTFDKLRLIVTHRDPVKCVTSIANPVKYTRKLYSDTEVSEGFAESLIQLFGFMADQHLKWRDSNPNIEILDLSFNDITHNGEGVARKVYEFLDVPFTDESLSAIRNWEKENDREKHGRNVYSSEEIGTRDAVIRKAFESYIDRYGQYL